MRVFLTGATGYIGNTVAEALISAGHEVVGLARSDQSAEKLTAAGVTPYRGDIKDLDSLKEGASAAECVIHTGFSADDLSRLDIAFAQEGGAVEAMLSVLGGTAKSFLYTSGAGVFADTGDQVVDETDTPNATGDVGLRIPIEQTVLKASEQNIRTIVIRPGLVYGKGGSGVMHALIGLVQQAGATHTVGNGHHAWSSIHVEDLAKLYVKAIEKGPAGSVFHGVSENEASMLDIASAIARALKLEGPAIVWPVEEAKNVLGPLAEGLASNKRLSAAKTREALGWVPNGLGVIEEIEHGSYRAGFTAMAG
ncbi:MAG: SDR family oxidoreductase [Pseudomonadota bacterium]